MIFSFKTLLVSCIIGFLLVTVNASDVIDASEGNFDDLVATGVSLVKFYAPWCGHCKSLAPHWEEAATELKGHVNFIKVDATIEQSLASRYDVQGYPTIKVFQDGAVSDYEGGRTTRDLVSFAKRRLSPTVESIRTKEQLDSLQGQDLVILLYTADESSTAMKEFIETAKKLRDSHRFAAVVSTDLFKGQSEGAIVMLKPFDKDPIIFPNNNNEITFEDWIRNESFPLIGEIGPDNYRQYIERALPIAWLFVAPTVEGEDSTVIPTSLLQDAAAAHKGKLSFVYLDGERYRQLLKRYGFQLESLPKFVIETSEHFWSFPEDKTLTAETIEGFCMEFTTGTLERTVLSEPIPETPVVKGLTTVVGLSMKEVVLESTNDVLIEFYAPWCGHCKSLIPIYESLAEKLEVIPTVVVAKMDATSNEVAPDFQVSGFPTIYFKPAGKSPMLYEGERSLEGMLSFIQQHATHVFTLDDQNDISQEL